jgi:hypothetical protein
VPLEILLAATKQPIEEMNEGITLFCAQSILLDETSPIGKVAIDIEISVPSQQHVAECYHIRVPCTGSAATVILPRRVRA